MSRPPIMGRHGMVASAHYLASTAGLRVLMDGGNAIDAAIATAATLHVVEPYMSGMGGDGLMTISLPGEQAPIVLDYSGPAPREASLATQTPEMSERGPASMLVPGAVAGWLAALERYGTMPPSRVFADAIDLAEQGAPVSYLNNWFIDHHANRIEPWENAARTFLPSGAAPRPATMLRQPQLAETFRRVAEGGMDEFYRGALAREIVSAVRSAGGLLSEDDLAAFQVEWQTPVSIDFNGFRVFAPPPPSYGFQTLQTLGMLEHDLNDIDRWSADYLQLVIEAIKLATADRIAYTMRDDIDLDALLSSDYLRERRRLIDGDAAFGPGQRFESPDTRLPHVVQPGSPRVTRRNSEHTTHFAAVDSTGLAVNVTQSLGTGFGSGFMAGDTGLLMNNFLNWVDLDPESPNALAGGKQMENCMAPMHVYRDGRFVMTMGTPGSWGIPQTQAQALLNVLAFGMNLQEAIEAPRVRLTTGRKVSIEGRVPTSMTDELSSRGHEVERIEDYTWFVGGMQAVSRDPATGVLVGAADPRRDGYAVGW